MDGPDGALYDGLADGEAKPCSTAGPAARTIGAIETLKNMGQRGLGDTFALVRDPQLRQCTARLH